MRALFPTSRQLAATQAIRAFALWAFALLVVLALPAKAEVQEVRLGQRFYQIDLPARAKDAPIILALHGGGGDPSQFAKASGLGLAATAKGYAVIFPAGSSRRGGARLLTWNAGYCCGYASKSAIDDIAFLNDVIADASARFGVDSGKIFLTGMSNGSIMAETFAASVPGVAAVAGVAGTMDTSRVRVKGAVPVVIIHGTDDPMVPYAGGGGSDSLTKMEFSSVDSVVQAFLEAQPGMLTKTIRQIDTRDDGTSVTVTDWARGGTVRVRLMKIDGGGHHWPGGRKARLDSGKTQEIDANVEILRFFDQYR